MLMDVSIIIGKAFGVYYLAGFIITILCELMEGKEYAKVRKS